MLQDYKAEFGDCLVSQEFVYKDLNLGNWVAAQRSRKERLSKEQISRLDKLGFIWDAIDQQWEDNFNALVAYKKEFGDCLVPASFIYKGLKLGVWVTGKRSRKARLSEEQIARLDAIGFIWDPYTQQWEDNFNALVAYKKEFGDCLVPDKFAYNGLTLGTWVGNQRSRKERLSKEQISRLDKLGFIWDPYTQQWEDGFNALVAYKAEFGDCLVPRKFAYNGLTLGTWVGKQRLNKERLSKEQIARLDAIGFVWNTITQQWEDGFNALVAYKTEFGDCLVPRDFVYKGLRLGLWVGTQRRPKNTLSKEQISRLDKLGFIWDAIDQQWEDNFNALVAYKKEFGDCLVPDKLLTTVSL